MTRPRVSVVVPFAGDPPPGAEALGMLRALDTRDGDQLILSDNCGSARRPRLRTGVAGSSAPLASARPHTRATPVPRMRTAMDPVSRRRCPRSRRPA